MIGTRKRREEIGCFHYSIFGRRDKAFDPQAMQKVRAACAVLAEDGTYPFDLSVTDPEIYRQVSAWFTDLLRKS